MIANATRLVETEQYQSPYSLIFVDKFQHICESSTKLIKALKHQKPSPEILRLHPDVVYVPIRVSCGAPSACRAARASGTTRAGKAFVSTLKPAD